MADGYVKLAKVTELQTATVSVTTSTDGLSSSLALRGHTVVGVYMPSAWTSANLTFLSSPDDVTYYSVYSSTGAELTVTGISTSVARLYYLSPSDLLAVDYLKVRSGGSTGETAQGAARSVTLALKKID